MAITFITPATSLQTALAAHALELWTTSSSDPVEQARLEQVARQQVETELAAQRAAEQLRTAQQSDAQAAARRVEDSVLAEQSAWVRQARLNAYSGAAALA
jgi:hypothetical protein